MATDASINLRPKISIVMDNISSVSDNIFNFSRFKQLPENFDFLPLDFGNESVFLLGFPDLNLFDSLRIFLSNVLLPFNDTLFH